MTVPGGFSTSHPERATSPHGFTTAHSEADLLRERTMAALGGRMQGCAAALAGWRDPTIRLPPPMATLRADFLRYYTDADTEAIATALDRGLDPHLHDEHGRSLLHRLAWLPDTDLLPRLLSAGLDLHEPDAEGRTPLQVAVEYGSPELVRALLTAGAARTGIATRRPDLWFVNAPNR